MGIETIGIMLWSALFVLILTVLLILNTSNRYWSATELVFKYVNYRIFETNDLDEDMDYYDLMIKKSWSFILAIFIFNKYAFIKREYLKDVKLSENYDVRKAVEKNKEKIELYTYIQDKYTEIMSEFHKAKTASYKNEYSRDICINRIKKDFEDFKNYVIDKLGNEWYDYYIGGDNNEVKEIEI